MGAVCPPMREEHPLMIALEVGVLMLMPIAATGEPAIDSSVAKTQWNRIDPLTVDDRLTDVRCRDQYSSKSMFSLPWEGDE